MNLNEEEIQRAVESGQTRDDIDARSYKLVFSALENDKILSHQLPPAFADKVIQKILAQQQQKKSSDMWWLGLGIFMLLIFLIISIAFVGVSFNLHFLNTLSEYKWLITLGAILIIVFNVIDKKYIRPRIETK